MESDKNITKSNSSTTSIESTDSNIVVKLRRLKIQEGVLTKNIRKCFENSGEKNEENNNVNTCIEYRSVNNDLRKSFFTIRDLFDELKESTSSKDNIRTLDLNDMKKDVIDLDEKIGSYKTFLESQRKLLKLNEQQLKCDNAEENVNNVIEKFVNKTKNKQLNDIVPSPVKIFMNSPYKCPEIQEFQEFMKNSKNRCGGWNPYYHNVFVKSWHKYFSTQENIEDYDYQEVNVENSQYFSSFLLELWKQIPEISAEEIILHNKWYTKFIYLKERQRRALEKWKSKKHVIKKGSVVNLELQYEQKQNRNIKKCNEMLMHKSNNLKFVVDEINRSHVEDKYVKQGSSVDNDNKTEKRTYNWKQENNKIKIKRSPFAYRQATKQWLNKCKDIDEPAEIVMDVGNIIKRGIPDWRLILQSNNELS